MELKGTIKPSDYYAAELLHIRPRKSFGVVGVLLLILGLGVIWKGLSAPEIAVETWIVLGGLILLALELVVYRPYRLTRNFNENKNMQREVKISISDTSIRAENEIGHMDRPWTDFSKWKEGRKVFSLYVSSAQSLTVPKHFFESERDIEEFRELLKFKVKKNDA